MFNNKSKSILLLLFIALFFGGRIAFAEINNALLGKIFLQTESNGEAWYVHPLDQKRYYLGRPTDAFRLMRIFSVGISNNNLNKIPIGIIGYNDEDDDKDGLANRLEQAIGSDPKNKDTDFDNFEDATEIENQYNPNGEGMIPIDSEFTKKQIGKIFLQTEQNGEAWYVNPSDQKRYYLGRPSDAFSIMQKLSHGISNKDISNIPIGKLPADSAQTENQNTNTPFPQEPKNSQSSVADAVVSKTAEAIRKKDKASAVSYFIPELKDQIEYIFDNMNNESLFILGNILSGASLSEASNEERRYINKVYFDLGSQYITLEFIVQKQDNGEWLLTNL